jgi:hypothetical protein
LRRLCEDALVYPEPMDFRAAAAFAGDVESVLMVALAERPDGSGRSVILQRASRPSPDDPLDAGYSISTETGATVYDPLVDWRLADDELVLDLTSDAARLLGCAPRIAIGVMTDKRTRDGVADRIVRCDRCERERRGRSLRTDGGYRRMVPRLLDVHHPRWVLARGALRSWVEHDRRASDQKSTLTDFQRVALE